MPDKKITYGVPGGSAEYQSGDNDPTGGGNFVVAERLDSNGDPVDVLLEWDETADEWRYGGPVNLNGEDVTNVGALDANSVSTASLDIGGVYHYAADDSSLNARLSGASDGDTIILGASEFTDNRTINTSLTFVGTNGTNGTVVSGDWTTEERCFFEKIRWEGNLTLTTDAFQWVHGSTISSGSGSITVDVDNCLIESLGNTSVTFTSGTSGGLVDSCINVTVTDDGSNTIGDIS